jgi:hypothetical protein
MNESHPLPGASRPLGQSGPTGQPTLTPRPLPGAPAKPKDDFSPVGLVDSPHPGKETASKIQVYGVGAMTEREYHRHANMTGNGACHVKSFHGRLNEDGLQRIDDKINEFMEAHPELEIKFATTTIGIWDGKTKDPSMIINVWF